MKEIKTKPAGGKPKLLESAAKAPKTAMKDLWLKTKEKSVSELKETPFASQQEESSNASANTAADQMLSGTKSTVKKGADLTYRGGKKLAQTTAKKAREKREVSRVLKEAKEMAEKPAKGTASKIKSKDAMVKGLKGKPAKTVKTASQSMKGVKQGAKGIKTAQRSAKTAQQAAKAAQKTAQAAARAAKAAAQAAKAAAKAAATGVKIAVKATVAAVKAALLAIKGLIAAIAAGGWVAVVIILLICLIALIVGSCFGLFFGSDSTGTGTSVTQAVSALNGEYLSHIQEIEDSNPHDRQEITSNDGALSINWEDVLAVFSAKVTGAEDGAVTIANAIDSWGGGYGYHIKVKHNDTYETLYAHCSSICVTVGQEVKQGEVIGYVGTTGNSTGNHLHFEVWQNGERTDALGFFKAE